MSGRAVVCTDSASAMAYATYNNNDSHSVSAVLILLDSAIHRMKWPTRTTSLLRRSACFTSTKYVQSTQPSHSSRPPAPLFVQTS